MGLLLKRLLPLLVIWMTPAILLACSVPVFRYALDHWSADPYRVFIYHDQDLSESDLKLLSQASHDEHGRSNFTIRTVNLRSQLSVLDQARWDELPDKSTPRLVVQYPEQTGESAGLKELAFGSAPWNESELHRLISSPLRVELGKRLIDGEVVWLFLESENEADNSRLFELLNQQLTLLQETLTLPEVKTEDLVDQSTSPDGWKIRFSTLRISRNDPAEKWLVEMLLASEPDLQDAELVDKPMVFPVFGRGRVLYALVDNGINSGTIAEAATFLTSACQCTVKADNPGVELLIPARWDQIVPMTRPSSNDVPLIGLGTGARDSATITAGSANMPIAAVEVGEIQKSTPVTDSSSTPIVPPATLAEAVSSATPNSAPVNDHSVIWQSSIALLVIGGIIFFVNGMLLMRRR